MPATGAFTSVRSMRTSSACTSASRLLRSASQTPSAFCAAANWACAVSIAISRCSTVDADMIPASSLSRVRIRIRKLHLRLRLRDQASRLIDRCVGALCRGVILRHERIELGAIEAGEHLALPNPVAILGVEFDDREPIDQGRDLRFLARHQSARDEQPIDEFALCAGTMVTAGGSTARGVSAADLPTPGRRRLCRERFCRSARAAGRMARQRSQPRRRRARPPQPWRR